MEHSSSSSSSSSSWASSTPVCGAWACFAHALQCLCDGRACCPPRALQLVICVFLRSHRHRHPVVSTRCFTGIVRDGVKIPQDGNRANKYRHVVVVHEHVWRNNLAQRICKGSRFIELATCVLRTLPLFHHLTLSFQVQ